MKTLDRSEQNPRTVDATQQASNREATAEPGDAAIPIGIVHTVVVFISLLCAGYLTGLFGVWSAAVMPGLGTTDDQTFVAAIQGLETRFDGGDSIIPDQNGNWPTFIAFFTGPLWIGAALFLHRRHAAVSRLLAFALGCLVLGTITTLLFNVPANLAIVAAGDPSLPGVDAAQVRADFDELSWLQWNHVRAVTATLAFVALAWAFRLQGSIAPATAVEPR